MKNFRVWDNQEEKDITNDDNFLMNTQGELFVCGKIGNVPIKLNEDRYKIKDVTCYFTKDTHEWSCDDTVDAWTHCSNCHGALGTSAIGLDNFNYCPLCGATIIDHKVRKGKRYFNGKEVKPDKE